MHGEHNGSNGQGRWEDRDEFRRLMDSLSQEELREMLKRLNADIAANPDDTNTLGRCISSLGPRARLVQREGAPPDCLHTF